MSPERLAENTTYKEQLAAWHMIVLVGKKGEYEIDYTVEGLSVDHFWHVLDEVCIDAKLIWIVSDHAARNLSLLGWWGKIEDGSFGQDIFTADLSPRLDKIAKKKPRCILITDDPPTIVTGRYGRLLRQIKYVDICNYGFRMDAAETDCVANACHIASLMQSMITWLYDNELGSLQLTSGSQALYAFRKNYLQTPVLVHTVKSVLDLEGDAYVGGRCEVFRFPTRGERITHLDIVSSYASVMAETALPVRLIASHGNCSVTYFSAENHQSHAIAKVSIDTPEPAYPYRRQGIVIYPTGIFTTTLAGPELSDAIEKGRVHYIHSWCEYDMDPFLVHYAKDLAAILIRIRSGGSSPLSGYIKRLINSLYGKFGQKIVQWIPCLDVPSDMPYGSWVSANKQGNLEQWRSISWLTQKRCIAAWSPTALPAVAAWITSQARVNLLRLLRLAGKQSTLYVDTDAIFVNETGLMNLTSGYKVSSGSLGSLSLKETSDDVEIYGLKHYRFGGRHVCSGLPRAAEEMAGSSTMYIRRPGALEQAMGGKRPEAIARIGRYSTRSDYRHGVLRSDGTITPHHFDG